MEGFWQGKTCELTGFRRARRMLTNSTGAGGKPSTWFPPERLVEISHIKFEYFCVYMKFLTPFLNDLNVFLQFFETDWSIWAQMGPKWAQGPKTHCPCPRAHWARAHWARGPGPTVPSGPGPLGPWGPGPGPRVPLGTRPLGPRAQGLRKKGRLCYFFWALDILTVSASRFCLTFFYHYSCGDIEPNLMH